MVVVFFTRDHSTMLIAMQSHALLLAHATLRTGAGTRPTGTAALDAAAGLLLHRLLVAILLSSNRGSRLADLVCYVIGKAVTVLTHEASPSGFLEKTRRYNGEPGNVPNFRGALPVLWH